MSGISFFDDVATVGSELLGDLNGRTDDVAPFIRRTRDVYELMVKIHDDLLNTIAEVSVTRTLDEGRRVLRSLHRDALESVFRARRWCDELESLGEDLAALPLGTQIADTETWNEFTQVLRQREGEVAWLYESALFDVLSQAERAVTIEELTTYMESVGDRLVIQKAQFDRLAKRAAAIARRRP